MRSAVTTTDPVPTLFPLGAYGEVTIAAMARIAVAAKPLFIFLVSLPADVVGEPADDGEAAPIPRLREIPPPRDFKKVYELPGKKVKRH